MTDPTTAQGELTEIVKAIRDHRTLGPIFAMATDTELADALAALEPDGLVILQIQFGLGRPKGSFGDIKAAVPGVTDARSAYLAAGQQLQGLVEARVEERFRRQPDQLSDFAMKVRAMLHNAGILAIPQDGTFTEDQCRLLIEVQPWTIALTDSFDDTLRKRGDHRTLRALMHPNLSNISYVQRRVRTKPS